MATRPMRFFWMVCSATLVLLAPKAADAASCKGDKRLDVPMQFTASVESAGRVRLSAFGGYDKSRWVMPLGFGAWRLYDAAGRQLDQFTRADLGFASNDMLKETTVEGLVPGTSYIIELTSQDYCNNKGTHREVVTIPAAAPETNGPVVSAPSVVRTGFLTSDTRLTFSVTDDTGVKRVTVFIDGNQINEYRYFDGFRFRWWCDEYTLDTVTSTLEGPNYYLSYPAGYKGRSALVEIVVEDAYGNMTRSSAQLSL